MLVGEQAFTSLWYQPDNHRVVIIDQTRLPHAFELVELTQLPMFCTAIATMQVRGAPLIGATAAFGLAFALLENGDEINGQMAYRQLLETRPTAVNLRWALDRVWRAVAGLTPQQRGPAALAEAQAIRQLDIDTNAKIGEHGLALLQQLAQHLPTPRRLNILTHCNAGWLATIDWGTALAPVYKAQASQLDIHVWVNETRPRNQGASLTAWELRQQGIPHTVIPDNAAGHLMQQGEVDLCLVGSDRTSANGDVCNKIGTYLRALAAQDNRVPFYVALPESTIDWQIDNGLRDIPIEQRSSREVTHISGLDSEGNIREVQLIDGSAIANYAFDVTPARLVSGLVTEYGIFHPGQLAELQRLATGSEA